MIILIDNITDKKEVNNIKQDEKLNDKNYNLLAERLLERSKRFDFNNTLKNNDNEEKEDSFNDELESQKVNFVRSSNRPPRVSRPHTTPTSPTSSSSR